MIVGRVLPAANTGANQDQGIHQLWMLQRRVQRHRAAKRGSQERGRPHPDRIHEVKQVVDAGIRAVGNVGLPEPPHVVAEHSIFLCERWKLRVPAPTVCDARVHQHQRRPFAGDLVVELDTIDLGKAGL